MVKVTEIGAGIRRYHELKATNVHALTQYVLESDSVSL
jgi:hypothetical protein